MNAYLYIIVTIGLSGPVTEIVYVNTFVTMVNCSHTVGRYFVLYIKTVAQKLTEKMRFRKIRVCDLL